MNIYFDTEFTGLVPNTTLISIGCVAESGEKFYAEFTDYDRNLVDSWCRENVIANLYLKKDPNKSSGLVTYDSDKGLYEVKGDTHTVRKYFTDWLEFELLHKPGTDPKRRIQFVSDVCHYDFYLLCNQIFGGAFNIPEFVNPVCYDICQDIGIAMYKEAKPFDLSVAMDVGFNYSREAFLKDVLCEELPSGRKHNSLYDAEVIKKIYEEMRRN